MIVLYLFLSTIVLLQKGYYVIGSEYISLNGLIANENDKKEIEQIFKKNSTEIKKLSNESYFKENNYRFLRPYYIEKDIFIDFFCFNVLEDNESIEFLKSIAKEDENYFRGEYLAVDGKLVYNKNFAKKYCEKYGGRLPKPQELEIALNYYKISPCSLSKVGYKNNIEYAIDDFGNIYMVILKGDSLGNFKIISILQANMDFKNTPFRCVRNK